MRWYKYLLLSILLFIFPPIVKANICSNSEIVKYQELAKNIDITYDYIEENSNIIFNIKINNMVPGLVIKDVKHDKYYNYTSSEIELVDNFYQGTSYKFYIYMDNDNCLNKKVYSHYITLPYYNYYYNSELCKGIEEFKYCQKWVKTPSTYDEFFKEIENYRKSLSKKNKNPEIETEYKGLLYEAGRLYLKSYYIVLPIIIIVGIILIIKKRKNDDLF